MGSTPTKVQEYAVPFTSQENQEESKTSTPIFRQKQCIPNLISNYKEPLYKVYTIFYRSYKKFPKRKCFGTPVPATQTQPAHYEWLTYYQVHLYILKTAQLIQKYNLQSEQHQFIGIMAPNSNEWMFLDLAVNLLNYALVPFFQALNAQAVAHILDETEMTSIFGSNKDLLHFVKQAHDSKVKYLITFDKEVSQELRQAAGDRYEILVFNDEINEVPQIHQDQELNIPQKSDQQTLKSIFTLSYTSGTTGTPKGAMISNQNMISAMANCKYGVRTNQNDVIINYLPLAHVFGRVIYFIMLQDGGSIGNFGGDVKLLINDVNLLKPTIFPAVPRVLNRLYDTIIAAVGKTSGMKKYLFNKGIKAKIQDLRKQGTVTHGFYDRVVFKNLRAKLGGNVRIMITASAPISSEVMQFFRVGFSVDMFEAYGQTESSGSSFLTHSFENNCGYVGGPTVGTEYKLQDVAQLEYLTSDKPYPRGQVCIRGPGVFMGYFKNQERTKEAIDQEGWLHTGDVGMIVEGGALKIIDRVKNIFKLSQGQYIAPEKLERAYGSCESIAQIFVYGDSLRSNVVAIIVPDEAVVMEMKKSKGWQVGDLFQDVCNSEELRTQVLKQMQAAAKKAKLNGLEQVRDKFKLSPILWTDNDLLTPTMKLKRHKARDHFKNLIDQIYESK